DYDTRLWNEIEKLRREIGKETLRRKSLLMQIKEALDQGDYSRASELQVVVKEKISELTDLYAKYKKNIM
ncbi:MAG: glutamine synthetase, partial [Eubacterium sp.]